jgi:hypothetical protein
MVVFIESMGIHFGKWWFDHFLAFGECLVSTYRVGIPLEFRLNDDCLSWFVLETTFVVLGYLKHFPGGGIP